MTTRRGLLRAGAALLAGGPAYASVPELRLGTLQFGTVQWVADVISRNGLDVKHGFALKSVTLANTDAGRVSLMAGGSDVILSDWMFVAAQRAAGTRLSCAPFSSSTGGIMVGGDSSVRALTDLKGRKLGVAGGPVDKSWLVVRAAGRAQQIDLASAASVVYGAPPLLGAKLAQGELDAVLTFWNFAARLEADGYRQMISVADCSVALGLSPRQALLGFVFKQDWAAANRPAIDGFLAVVTEANQLLATSDGEWQAIRPLMNAPDDALYLRLRERFIAGTALEPAAAQAESAARLFALLHETGGSAATSGIDVLPPGVFWPNEAT